MSVPLYCYLVWSVLCLVLRNFILLGRYYVRHYVLLPCVVFMYTLQPQPGVCYYEGKGRSYLGGCRN